MITGVVTGNIWATKRVDGVPPGAWLAIKSSDRGTIVAFDPLGSGDGDEGVVATGSTAAKYLGGDAPIDAVVIGIVDPLPRPNRPEGSTNKMGM